MTLIKPRTKKTKTRAFNISLDEQAVAEAKKKLVDQSFSLYLSNLIKEDLNKKNQLKKLSDIFGKSFKFIEFKTAEEEKNYYELIGLKDYELHNKD